VIASTAGKAAAAAPVAAKKDESAKPAAASSNGSTAERGGVEPVAHEVVAHHADGGRIKSSPLARKVAAGEGVDIAQVKGSGPGGRVVRSDVEAHLKTRGSAPASSAKPAAAAARQVLADTVIKLN